MPRIAVLKKRPDEEYSIGLKFITPDLEDADVIISAVVKVIPDIPGELVAIGAPVIDEDVVSQYIRGGLHGKDYYVNFKVTTTQGYVFEDYIFVNVRELVAC